MLKIILIRPGSTEYDRQGRIQGTLDIPLSEEGRQEVVRVIEELKSHAMETLYTTPCQSAQQTAQAIAESLNLKKKNSTFYIQMIAGVFLWIQITLSRFLLKKIY